MKLNPSTASPTRRQWLGLGLGTSALPLLPASTSAASTSQSDTNHGFRFCLNTSTIRKQGLPITKEIDLCARHGYTGIEPWMRELRSYTESGGKLADLRKRLDDQGITVESAIGFARWIVDDDAQRAAGLEEAKRDMDVLAQIGAKTIAAPPVGATKEAGLNLFKAAERYRALCEVGDEFGVTPQVEVWGFSKNLSRLGESVFVAIESGHPKACLLPDFFHIYKGGSDFNGLGLLGPNAIHCFHINDYPADPPREKISDKDRVWPGDGIAPIGPVLRQLHANGCTPALSLELFNPTYWKLDAEVAVKTGIDKMKAAVDAAFTQP